VSEHTTSGVPRKTCSKCQRALPISQFDADRRKAYGVTSHCKDCRRAYRQANKRRLLQAQYIRRADNPNYDRQRVAWNKVYYALQHGQLQKPDTCEVCGAQLGVDNIQAHHDDYDKPFEIIWCCQNCHITLDKARRIVVPVERQTAGAGQRASGEEKDQSA